MNKTLKEIMENEVFENGICIGSKTSFFYIGENDYEQVKSKLNEHKNNMEMNTKKNLEKAERYALNPVVLNCVDKNGNEDTEANAKKLRNRMESFFRAYSGYLAGQKYLNEFVDLDKRIAKEVYVRETDRRTVIIIDGNENGDLWFDYEK